MLINKCEAITLESLYRANLAKSFMEDERFETEIIFVEADFEKRVKREFSKLEKNANHLSLNELTKEIKKKDNFKISKGALEVKKISTKTIENNGTLEQYKTKLIEIYNLK